MRVLCSSSSTGSSLAKMLRRHTGGASRTSIACFLAGGGSMPAGQIGCQRAWHLRSIKHAARRLAHIHSTPACVEAAD